MGLTATAAKVVQSGLSSMAASLRLLFCSWCASRLSVRMWALMPPRLRFHYASSWRVEGPVHLLSASVGRVVGCTSFAFGFASSRGHVVRRLPLSPAFRGRDLSYVCSCWAGCFCTVMLVFPPAWHALFSLFERPTLLLSASFGRVHGGTSYAPAVAFPGEVMVELLLLFAAFERRDLHSTGAC